MFESLEKAPEVIVNKKASFESDVWSFGVLIFEILTYAAKPYSHLNNNDKIVEKIRNGTLTLEHENKIPMGVSKTAENIEYINRKYIEYTNILYRKT